MYNSEINYTTKLIILKSLSQQLTLRFYVEICDVFIYLFIYLHLYVYIYY